MTTYWYSNGKRRAYHRAATTWIRTGKAVCGRTIARPTYLWDSTTDGRSRPLPRPCADCLRHDRHNS